MKYSHDANGSPLPDDPHVRSPESEAIPPPRDVSELDVQGYVWDAERETFLMVYYESVRDDNRQAVVSDGVRRYRFQVEPGSYTWRSTDGDRFTLLCGPRTYVLLGLPAAPRP